MIKSELKKLLIKQKGLLIIIAFIILKAVILFLSPYDSDYHIDRNHEAYRFYIEQYKGKLSAEKEKAIKDEYYAVNHASEKLNELSWEWKEGTISRTEYETLTKEYFQKQKNEEVFSIIFNQYFYAKQDPERRYILDERGWRTLLCHSRADIPLLLCLIALLTPLFCQEYESDMYALLLTSPNGKLKTCISKLAVAIFLASSITVLFSFMEYAFINQKVGLSDGEFPLQSLSFFQNSPYNITLYQAFLLVMFFRVSGSVMLSGIICLSGILSKKSVMTLFAGSVLSFLPYVFFQNKPLLYYLPLPSGLLSGVGYLWGTLYTTSYDEQGIIREIQFYGIEKNTLILLFIGFIIETLLIFYLCIIKFIGHRPGTVKKKNYQVIYCLIALFLSIIPLAGCHTSSETENLLTVNAKQSLREGETSKYKIRLDIKENNIFATDKETGEEIELLRTPFDIGIDIQAIFVNDEYCYYLFKIPNKTGIRINRINVSNFETELFYNNIETNSYANFFTLDIFKPANPDEMLSYLGSVFCFFLDNNYIYYGLDSQLIQIDKRSNHEVVIADDVLEWGSVCYFNGDVFYVDILHRLNRYSKKENKVQAIDTVYTNQFSIEGNILIYQDLLDNRLKKYPIGGE